MGKFLEWASIILNSQQKCRVLGYSFRSLPRTGMIPLVDDGTIQTRYYTFIMICFYSIGTFDIRHPKNQIS